jgi:dolichyl-phosphate beta-glucosyltransferase
VIPPASRITPCGFRTTDYESFPLEAVITDEDPFLSIVIPAFNEASRLPASLEQVTSYLAAQAYTSEILVVDDGSADDTAGAAEAFASRFPALRVLRQPHRGKGGTVKAGMLAAQGEHILFADADFSMPVGDLAKFLPVLRAGYDVAIASREGPGARRFHEPEYRHLMGRVYNLIVQVFAIRGLRDTQCGFKCFRRGVAQQVFALQTMDGWGFDVEVLFIARKRGFRITEVPIDWYYGASSKVSPVRDTIRMFQEVFQVRWNDLRGRYR